MSALDPNPQSSRWLYGQIVSDNATAGVSLRRYEPDSNVEMAVGRFAKAV